LLKSRENILLKNASSYVFWNNIINFIQIVGKMLKICDLATWDDKITNNMQKFPLIPLNLWESEYVQKFKEENFNT